MTLFSNLCRYSESKAPPAPQYHDIRSGDIIPSVSDDLIKDAVERADRIAIEPRDTPDGYTHMTSLIGGCPRMNVIIQRFDPGLTSSVKGPMRIVWAMGKAAESHARDNFISMMADNTVYGVWSCKCAATTRAGTKQEQICSSCRTPVDNYVEPVLHNQEYGVVGKPDLTYMVSGIYKLVVEFKSINKKEFDDLSRAKADHLIQAFSYRRLYADMGHKVHDCVKVVYLCKDYMFKGSPYKEYTQHFEDMGPGVDLAFEKGKSIKQHTTDGTLPDRLEESCQSIDNLRPRNCLVSDMCFNL